jgi:hypothetical protein
VLIAAALELLEEDVGNAVDDVAGRAVERLVVQVEELTPGGAEAPAAGEPLRIADGGGIERRAAGACQLTTIGISASCTQRRPT